MNIHWKDWWWSWSSNTLATWYKELIHWKRLWCWARLKAVGEGDDRGWDGWMVSPTRWTWVWVNSTSWWWTGKPGVLQFMGLQRVRHYWVTELNHFIFPLTMYKDSNVSTSPPTPVVFHFLEYNHPDRYQVVSYLWFWLPFF